MHSIHILGIVRGGKNLSLRVCDFGELSLKCSENGFLALALKLDNILGYTYIYILTVIALVLDFTIRYFHNKW